MASVCSVKAAADQQAHRCELEQLALLGRAFEQLNLQTNPSDIAPPILYAYRLPSPLRGPRVSSGHAAG